MTDDPRDELSPAERRAMGALPRERAPSPDLEERTVALLRAHGHLATPIGVSRGAGHWWRGPWLVGAVAAALAIFASGIVVGQLLGERNALLLVGASSRASEAQLAAHVERAGRLYVATLASLNQSKDTTDTPARLAAREAALAVLGSAAEEISHLAPDDPLAAAVLRGLNQRNRQQEPAAPSRSVVWY